MRRALLLTALLATGCADLATRPDRVPAEIVVSESVVTLTEGQPVPLAVSILDQHGAELTIPAWAPPAWSSSNAKVVAVRDGAPRAMGPGKATATVTIAGLTSSATVRVNPATIQLAVDTVEVWQNGTRAEVLAVGEEATVRVGLLADKPNFFQPTVRVNVRRGDVLVQALDAVATAESIPQERDPSAVWSVTLPGSLVQPGHSLEIVPDPARALPHVAGSEARYPAAGTLPLRFGLEVRVRGVYLTQGIQRTDGSVPLVAGRDALLRVFVTADQNINTYPTVRATLYRDGAVVGRYDMQRFEPSFPQSVLEGSIGSSWNVLIPGRLLAPGVSLSVDVDPEQAIPLTDGSTTRFPSAGQATLDVRDVPKLWVRMIPVYQTAFGTTGNVSVANVWAYRKALVEKFPIAEADIDVRSVYVTNARLDTSSGWSQLLREVEALRRADGSGRYYYGVVTHPGGAGTPGGLGYIGWPAAIGYDRHPYGMETFAHELGHNFGLPHAPCGNPAGVDASFPYAAGGIGVWGYDFSSRTLKNPATEKDLMSYCGPEWISDYNYLKVLGFRDRWDWTGTGPDNSARREPALLVWGGVQNGRMVLEPAFELDMPAALPETGGRYRVDGFDAQGARIFSYAFEPPAVDHRAGDRSFAFAIPAGIARPDRLARIEFSGPEGVARSDRAPASAPRAAATQRQGANLSLSWADDDFPMALVRDAQTGEIISFARGGEARIYAPGRSVEVLLSDGVRSHRGGVNPIR